MTTDVSIKTRPLPETCGCRDTSDPDSRIHERVEVGPEPLGIDAWRGRGGLLKKTPRHKPTRGHRPQLGHRHPVPGDHEALPCLHFPENGSGIVTELALGDRPHPNTVAGAGSANERCPGAFIGKGRCGYDATGGLD